MADEAAAPEAPKKPGYSDTPIVPGQSWKVHDCDRPQPRIVTPGTASTNDVAGAPPSDAVVLFNGVDLTNWSGKDGIPAPWKIEGGYMEVVPKSGDIQTKVEFGDCQLHVEVATPEVVEGESQGRGNSGIFLMGRYEIQVLDCYRNPTYADGTIGAIYGQTPPLVNACRKPGEWQTYDIVWIAPRFEGTRLLTPARITVIINGILIHHDRMLIGPTTHRAVAPYKPHPPIGPLRLQDHNNTTRFRNIWYRQLTDYDQE